MRRLEMAVIRSREGEGGGGIEALHSPLDPPLIVDYDDTHNQLCYMCFPPQKLALRHNEYKACGSPCTKTYDNYDDMYICAVMCEPGCFCREGTDKHAFQLMNAHVSS